MFIVAITSPKGGVGKTTTVASIGVALAKANAKVLLIDLSPMCDLSMSLGMGDPGSEDSTVYDVLCGNKKLEASFAEVGENIRLARGSTCLESAAVELANSEGREGILKEKVESAIAEGKFGFDYVLIDTPPALNLLTLNALCAAHHVIIPVPGRFLDLSVVARTLEAVQLAKRRNVGLKVLGYLMTMYNRQSQLAREVGEELESFIEQSRSSKTPWRDAQLFKTRIPYDERTAECPSFGQSVLDYAPKSSGAEAYRAVAEELVEALGLVAVDSSQNADQSGPFWRQTDDVRELVLIGANSKKRREADQKGFVQSNTHPPLRETAPVASEITDLMTFEEVMLTLRQAAVPAPEPTRIASLRHAVRWVQSTARELAAEEKSLFAEELTRILREERFMAKFEDQTYSTTVRINNGSICWRNNLHNDKTLEVPFRLVPAVRKKRRQESRSTH